nr:immunoglobulin light chain junction region [Macaca mulatta]
DYYCMIWHNNGWPF